jgi:hypothetical protein
LLPPWRGLKISSWPVAAAPVDGKWAIQDLILEIYGCQNFVCGRVAWTKDPHRRELDCGRTIVWGLSRRGSKHGITARYTTRPTATATVWKHRLIQMGLCKRGYSAASRCSGRPKSFAGSDQSRNRVGVKRAFAMPFIATASVHVSHHVNAHEAGHNRRHPPYGQVEMPQQEWRRPFRRQTWGEECQFDRGLIDSLPPTCGVSHWMVPLAPVGPGDNSQPHARRPRPPDHFTLAPRSRSVVAHPKVLGGLMLQKWAVRSSRDDDFSVLTSGSPCVAACAKPVRLPEPCSRRRPHVLECRSSCRCSRNLGTA